MDILSHLFVGTIFALIFKDYTLFDRYMIILLSALPDLLAFPHYFAVGIEKKRYLWFPKDIDFKGATKRLKNLMDIFYFSTHSLLFCATLYPILIWLNVNPTLLIFYLIHIVIDVFTHTGEWRTKILYPVSGVRFTGFIDAWKLSWTNLFYTWSFLSGLLILLYFSG